jgi:sec-independent protein translocase protein TatC
VAIAARPADRIPENDKRMELTEHLAELRSRIMRCILYVVVMASASYYLFPRMYSFLSAPMVKALQTHNNGPVDVQEWLRVGFTRAQAELIERKVHPATEWKFVIHHFTDAFFIVFKICLVAGLIFSLPLIIMEIYGFIAPALTREEKKPLRYVVPFSVLLFFAGVTLAYWVARFAIEWFVGYVPLFNNSILLQDPQPYIMFMLKMMGVFGLVFQLPVLLMFLAWVGILTASGMKKTWRHAIVGISVVGVIITPSNDLFTMLVMIVPVMGLYIASIWLVAFVEKKRAKARAAS